MEAELAGAHIFTEVLELMIGQTLNVTTVTRCMERVTDEMMEEGRCG